MVKIVITIGLIFPLGFLMGMPFPLGIRLVNAQNQGRESGIIPWLWATNSFCSIIASVSAVIMAILFGFKTVILSAVVIYLFGLFSLKKINIQF
jgi:hypothetical protein